ncbi:adenosylcobinamide-phosphate synthase [Aequitasia blattaphilus]|uniref:Cobalamin biosynthesis protein CobD n=1 Tax=Aequitasia blattaphilus TaxID=2949332 RepID=A0ABT1E8M1_9FIRM|nr:adenosylcobinamide-phosphate synthase CbiB [Aequitasia blattaphilus]MCP1102166.1 adenosylcobinamide-phosphate synthase CbiB [Aequitasia blattaphilus]MCR8614806.1 adenosylcobinamide-phosphate synthase CbiB [Aequitasia blattaphilus]
MRILTVCILGFLLDLMFGDPWFLYHPVRFIGSTIIILEKRLRKIAGNNNRRLLAAGGVLWIFVAGGSFVISFGLLKLAAFIHPALAFILEVFWCYQLLAARSLEKESLKVYNELYKGDLAGARQAVSMIVGRDTENLTQSGVTKATIETVAENTSDGVIAPLFYMLLGGAPLTFLYKGVNTMDSMIGYKNERYLYFGKIAAKMDDIFNYIPARISGCLMVAAAFLTGMNGKNAWKIYLRDRKNHGSPNAAQTESACAGALGIQLAGDGYYFGKLYKKPTIGDGLRESQVEDIKKACLLMKVTAWLMLIVGSMLRLVLILGLG